MQQSTLHLVVNGHIVPCLMGQPHAQKNAPVVILMHGLGAQKEVQANEMFHLCDAGWGAVVPDAPHHGERKDGTLEALEQADPLTRHRMFLELVNEWARELPGLCGALQEQGIQVRALAGISFGAYAAFKALASHLRLPVGITLLGSPSWEPMEPLPRETLRPLLLQAPVISPGRLRECALLSVHAGLDDKVSPQGTINLFEKLQYQGGVPPDRLRYLNYPASGHTMRAEDWWDAWRKIVYWLDTFAR
ncbi:MAG: alpha/beta fold hydrolase [Myxococcales bacterium]|nr:alpha/beta fold hydrolase [Myxococcales bacterium]MCB9643410.1 alpha/beta fold hydrolase [Myxococcales bacterium]